MMEALRRVANRVRLMVARAVVQLVLDSGKLQVVQVQLRAGEVRDAERFQTYGHTSVPFPGAEAIAVAVGGSTDHMVVIALDDRRHRPAGLQPGESTLYDDQGQMVYITRDGIVVDGAGKQVTFKNTPKVRMETNMLECTGEIKDKCDTPEGKTMSGMRTVYNGHTHNDPQGGVTNSPNQAM